MNQPPPQLFLNNVKKTKGKFPRWKDADTLGSVMATVNLPDAEINGSKQRKSVWHEQLRAEFTRLLPFLTAKHTELEDRQLIDLWNSRSGRSIAEQAQKGIALCRKLKGHLRVVEKHRITGNPSDADRMRCAVGLFNGVIKVSHLYDVIRNDKYVVGKPFPYPATFEWLNQSTNELDPVEMDSNLTIEGTAENDCDGIDSNTKVEGPVQSGAQVVADLDSQVAREEEDETRNRRMVSYKRAKGVKAAKAEKRVKVERDVEEDGFKDAIYSLSDKFGEVSSATIAAANARHEESRAHAERDYQLKKDADELEAVRVLFNDDDDDSKMYRNALKRKRLRKLLEEEEQS